MFLCRQSWNGFPSPLDPLLRERDRPINETSRAIGEAGGHRKIDLARTHNYEEFFM